MAEKMALTPAEAAEALGVSRGAIYDLCRTPDFPVIRLGRSIRIPRDRLREWVNNQNRKETA